jgi:hypothetical protein
METAKMRFLGAVRGYKRMEYKCNEHIRDKLGITYRPINTMKKKGSK